MSELKAALLGRELSHSLSPELHRMLFTMLDKKFHSEFNKCDYDLVECAEESDLSNWIKGAHHRGFAGANITYPYKSEAYSLSDRHFGNSLDIDSANCLRFDDTSVYSISTDGAGLLNSILREYPSFDLNRYHLIIVGAGNAARDVVYTLCTRWMPKSLTIINRTMAKAEELAEFCIAQAPGPTVRIMSADDFNFAPPENRYRHIIQCTPIGQKNHPGNLLNDFGWHETDFAIDLIYNPQRTVLLEQASYAGAKTLNGLGMLIEQAALSQVFWLTGMLPDASPLSQSEYETLKDSLTQLIQS